MQKITFKGSRGDTLAARLDTPDHKPKAYALFAHCFTCTKDIHGANSIAKALTARGIAVLRFDFTGLGASEGEFANTNFSSNVEDLIKAADYLREEHTAPDIIIGHSLGGTAVLSAAKNIPEARAVVTIASPADAEHVAHNFKADIATIEDKGEAEVKLAGRPFTIKKQFLEDIKSQNVRNDIHNLKKALLILHAPRDETVGIENAEAIYNAALHPKSFVTLDNADHLLSSKKDAEYAAAIIAAWASRYAGYDLETERGSKKDAAKNQYTSAQVIVRTTGHGKFRQHIQIGKHELTADEPQDLGGDNTGPAPYDLLMAALGACTSMTLRMYADHKGWTLDNVRVALSHEKQTDDDENGKQEKTDIFKRSLSVDGKDLNAEKREKLLQIANKCPVHKTLTENEVRIETHLAED